MKVKELLLKARISWIVIMGMLVFFTSTYAQQKKMLTSQDYKLWNLPDYNVYGQLSADGKWIMYKSLPLQNGAKGQMYTQNLSTGFKYDYPSATWGTFSQNSKWFAYIKGDTLGVQELSTNKRQLLTGISNYEFIADGNYLLSYNSVTPGKTIWIRNLKTSVTISIKNVLEFNLNPDKSALGIITEEGGVNGVKVLNIKSGMPVNLLVSGNERIYSGLVWNKTGTSLAFYERPKIDRQRVTGIYICRDITGKTSIKILDSLTFPKFLVELQVLPRSLYISDDSKQVFLYLKEHEINISANSAKNELASDVQIWHQNDKQVPPAKEQPASDIGQYVWWVDADKMLMVGEAKYPRTILTGDQKNALVYNTTDYLPIHNYRDEYIDLYLKDLNTGNKKLVIKQIYNSGSNTVGISPCGRYLSYFKNKQWWIYDIQKNIHRCITEGLQASFEDADFSTSFRKPPYGNPGWLENDSEIIVYDQFDIWIISPDGSRRTKITNGEKQNVTYRLADNPHGFITYEYSDKGGMLFSTLNNMNLDEGFVYWDKKGGLKQLLQKDRKLTLIYPKGKNFDNKKPFLYAESDFDKSPRLMLFQPSGKQQLIYQSNPQQKDFYWGKSELIHYNDAEGKPLKGVLIYPANYDPGKKYPMIVEIYQKRSSELHKYVTPHLSIESELNPTNYTADGYFILFPDILNKVNDPGISAAQCVMTAVEKALEKDLVDKDRIGLMGHSFGGYETVFIIGKTNLFKAAVAGSGITDLKGFYLTISDDFGSNIKRVENGQHQMQSPFYGDAFRRNSPMENVEHINTPLLLWAGEKDGNVDPDQSKKLQISLWHLGKKSNLLLYQGEGHTLLKEVNQQDLNMRVKNWFDYYLKDEKPADWILNGKIKNN